MTKKQLKIQGNTRSNSVHIASNKKVKEEIETVKQSILDMDFKKLLGCGG